MDHPLKPFRAIVLWMGVVGCASAPIHDVQLNPEGADIADIGSGRAIVLGELKNARNMLDGIPSEPGRFTHWQSDLEEKCGDRSVGGFFCLHDETPEELVRTLLGELLQDAGFKVLKKGPSTRGEELRVEGELQHFYFVTGAAPNGIVPGLSTAGIEFTLQFSKGGEELAEKRIHHEMSGRPFMHGSDDGQAQVAKYMDAALSEALNKTASYLASGRFREEVLGLPPAKASRARALEDGDDEDDE